MNPDQIGDSVETFVRDQFNVSDSDPGFDREVDLFDGGYVDSIGVAELLEYVTQEFGVDIPESDLFSDQFSSIEGIASIVARLQRS